MSRRTGQNLEDEIHCASYKFESETGSSIVPFRVAQCTEYRPFNQQGLTDMEKIAWIVEPRKKGPAGFQGEGTPMDMEIRPPKPQSDYDDD